MESSLRNESLEASFLEDKSSKASGSILCCYTWEKGRKKDLDK